MKRSLLFSCVLCLLIGLLIGVLLPVDWSPEKPATVDTGTMTFSTLDSSGSGSGSTSGSTASPCSRRAVVTADSPLVT